MENCNILIYANCKATECGAISPAIDQCMSGLLILIVSTLVLIVSLVSGARKRSAIEIGNWEHMLSVCHNLLDASKKQKVKKKRTKRIREEESFRRQWVSDGLWHSNFQRNILDKRPSVAEDFDFRELPKRK